MLKELEKCGLLKKSKKSKDVHVLRGLIKMWEGELEADPPSVAIGSQTTTDLNPRSSQAFPENLLCLAPPADQCSYAIIEQEDNKLSFDGEEKDLPQIDGVIPAITFMFSTNLVEFKLKLALRTIITISEKDLDNDLTIIPEKLSSVDRTAWNNFLEHRVRDGIQIKFLFTKSVGLVKKGHV